MENNAKEKNSLNGQIIVVQNEESNQEKKWTWGKYGHFIYKFKYWVLGFTLLGAIAGFLGTKFGYNAIKEYATVTFKPVFPTLTSEDGNVVKKTYFDGSDASLLGLTNKDKLEKVKASSPSFSSLNISKILEDGDISIAEVTNENDKLDATPTFYTIKAKVSSFGGERTSKQFLFALIDNEKASADWVIKIDDLSINQNNFEKDLTASMQYQGANEEQISLAKNDNATKQYYSEVLIRDVLLLKKAEEDKFFESEEAKSIINAAVRTLKAQYYLQRLILEASKNIPDPTPEQARAFFEQAKDQISQMYGITEYNTQTMPTINQLYKVAYSEQLVQRDITDLKDKAIIERNNSVLGEASMISPLQQGAQTNLLPRGN